MSGKFVTRYIVLTCPNRGWVVAEPMIKKTAGEIAAAAAAWKKHVKRCHQCGGRFKVTVQAQPPLAHPPARINVPATGRIHATKA